VGYGFDNLIYLDFHVAELQLYREKLMAIFRANQKVTGQSRKIEGLPRD
jgi:hypothetical protein